MQLTIRKAVGNDAAAYLAFLKTVGGETDNLSFGKDGITASPDAYAKVIDRVDASENSAMLLALDGSEIVGYCGIYGGDGRTAHRAEIAIFIRRDHWHLGIGSALLTEAKKVAQGFGMHILFLDVRSDNTRAISLYQKCGFTKTGVWHDFFRIDGQYYDVDCMELML